MHIHNCVVSYSFRILQILRIHQDVFFGNLTGMYMYVCYYAFGSKCFVLRNTWSDEGVSTVRSGGTVECRSTHLTSFAVLVDTQGSSSTATSAASVIAHCI